MVVFPAAPCVRLINNTRIRINYLILLIRPPAADLKRIGFPRTSRVIVGICKPLSVIGQPESISVLGKIIHIFKIN